MWKTYRAYLSLQRVVEESGLSRCIWDAEHAGSNPVYSTKFKTMASINKKNKAKNSYVFRNKSLVEKKFKIKRLYFFNSCMRRLLKEELKQITNVL